MHACPPPPVRIGQEDFAPVEGQEPEVSEEVEEPSDPVVEEVVADFDDGEPLVVSRAVQLHNGPLSGVLSSSPTAISPEKLREYPHACIALSDVATWGSHSTMSDTEAPSSSDELLSFEGQSDEEIDLDDEYVIHGGTPEVREHVSNLSESPGGSPAELDEQSVPVPEKLENEQCDADAEEPLVRVKKRRHKKKRRGLLTSSPPDFAAAVFEASETGHVDLIHRETIQQLVKEESGKRIVKTAEIRNCVAD